MYSALIVDDEPHVRSLLRGLIDWESLGFKIAAEAANGKLAAAKCYERGFDLIITDIRMPERNGMVFMRELETIQPDALIVIVTGYGEFDYAREALRCGAFDFLLKPVDEDALAAVAGRAKRVLDDHRQSERRRKELESELRRFHAVIATDENSKDGEGAGERHALVNRAIELITAAPSSRRGLEDVADELGVNPTYLSELFKREMNVGFHEYGAELRFSRARRLLEETDLLVKDIAASVGFGDPDYFVRAFRKRQGMSPSEYRISSKNRASSNKSG